MTHDQAAAYVAAQTALLNCRVAGMVAENQHRVSCGNSVAYDGKSFFEVEQEFEALIGFNEVVALYANSSHG